jgi:hypothetical protein
MEQKSPRNDLRPLRIGDQGQPVGIPPASAVQAVPEGTQTALMDLHPLWMLAPWAVFALAAGVKFWRITAVFRKRGLARETSTDQFRKTLERIWQKDQQAA